jgi:hypothetical protein
MGDKLIEDEIVEDVLKRINDKLINEGRIKEEEPKEVEMDEEQVLTMIFTRLKQLDADILSPEKDKAEKDRAKLVMNELLIYLETEFNIDVMVDVIKIVIEDVKHPIGPFSKSLTKKLLKLGWVIDNKTKLVRPMDDQELIQLFSQGK